jgi:hypothetical protein
MSRHFPESSMFGPAAGKTPSRGVDLRLNRRIVVDNGQLFSILPCERAAMDVQLRGLAIVVAASLSTCLPGIETHDPIAGNAEGVFLLTVRAPSPGRAVPGAE